MNNLQKVLALLVLTIALGSCAQDETMDELMGDVEINAPAPTGSGGDSPAPGGGD